MSGKPLKFTVLSLFPEIVDGFFQTSLMKKAVERHQKNINEFLEYAGYRYAVEIVGVGEEAQLRLRHIDHEEHLSGGNQHLSFGERNAFAIVLFMYECLSKKPDLTLVALISGIPDPTLVCVFPL